MSRFILLLSAFLLVACGNIDRGKAVRTTRAKTDGATATAAPTSEAVYANCKSFTVYQGTDASFAPTYNGMSACASTSQLNLVRLKVNAYFPIETRFCLVPLSFRGAFNATCFTVNGQLEVALSTEQFTSVAMVRESDLGAYTSYLSGQSPSYPAMAYANLR